MKNFVKNGNMNVCYSSLVQKLFRLFIYSVYADWVQNETRVNLYFMQSPPQPCLALYMY